MDLNLSAKRYLPHGGFQENIAIIREEDLKKIDNLPDRISDIHYVYIDNKKDNTERRNACAKVVVFDEEIDETLKLKEGEIYIEDRTLFEFLRLNENDEVFVTKLSKDKIPYAKELKIELVDGHKIEGWTEEKIKEAKSRIISSEIILSTNNLFWLFASRAKPLLSRVVETVPAGEYVRFNERTLISIVNLPKMEGAVKVTFNDIGGLEEQVRKIREMIQLPLEKPDIFKILGIEPPKGIILYGPPGTGKTLLARAISNEIEANFQSIRGPEILTKWAGEGEKRLREIFEIAKQNAPAIIFFDEIDSIAPSRDEAEGMISIRLVSQILDLMDGLLSRGKVFVIAATNRIHAIDPALRRPGRFDREIEISVPNLESRKHILGIYIRKMNTDNSVNIEALAKMTAGYTGADIASLCKEAGMKALRRLILFNNKGEIIQRSDLLVINKDDFVEAFKEIVPSTLRTIETEKLDIKMTDIIGLDDIKKRLSEIFREVFVDKKNRNFILDGPPNSGKSAVINAFANEYDLRIITLTPMDIMQEYYKEIGKVLKNAFNKAIQSSPSILLFDHLDSIFDNNEQLSKIDRYIVDTILKESQRFKIFKGVIMVATTYDSKRIPPLLVRNQGLFELVTIGSPLQKERTSMIKKFVQRIRKNWRK